MNKDKQANEKNETDKSN